MLEDILPTVLEI